MDLTKFLSLLHRKSLFFCRIDKLEDQYEGRTAKSNLDLRKNWWKNLRAKSYFKSPIDDLQINTNVQVLYELEKNLRALTCVNCWNKNDTESAALWKIYSDFNKGIMVKSSISKLERSFGLLKESLYLSEIRYLDYNKDMMPDGNTIFPMIHKHIAYSYEKEIRIIYELIPERGFDYDWSKEEVQEGKYFKVDLNELIKEIVIGPYSPNWFYSLIEDVMGKYNINKSILKSELSPE